MRSAWVALALVPAAACGGGAGSGAHAAAARAAPHEGYAGSERCAECHADVAAEWRASHHAQAERMVSPELDAAAFGSAAPMHDAPAGSAPIARGGVLALRTVGADGTLRDHAVERAIGVAPLRQYLVAAEGGRWQASELAWDPARAEWFGVFGSERRAPSEWGHWTGRGMSWNAQCADCHATDLVKGYDAARDAYATSWSELGVGCEACHGPGRAHAEAHARGDAGARAAELFPFGHSGERSVDACGACHARREELAERFVPGDRFLDAFSPELPGASDAYHADGQVHEEDYEYVSFHLSRLSAAGVTCVTCHDPHTGRTRLEGDALCLSCHAPPIAETVPEIDPATHSRHAPGSEGARCVGCHMPLTTYMQRDARHDHGFTVPDPRLTLELGIPNACNRCHADREAQWAVAEAERMFGADVLDGPRRARARAVAAARSVERDAHRAVLAWLDEETLPAWRAAGAQLLAPYAREPGVIEQLAELARDDAPIVRALAAQALADALPEGRALVEPLLEDPVRAVRVSAARTLAASVDAASVAGRDLAAYLAHVSDQPAGLAAAADVAMARGGAREAVDLLARAVRWDPGSAALHHGLGVALDAIGESAEAVRACQRACELAPEDATYRYALALAYHGSGDAAAARTALEATLAIEPRFARAWYTLGLLANATGDRRTADEALDRAVSLEPSSADAWFAWAAVLRDAGNVEKARWAAEQVLAIDPEDERARALLAELR